MAKSSGLNFNLPSVDDLFSTEEERAEARLEKVVNLSPRKSATSRITRLRSVWMKPCRK